MSIEVAQTSTGVEIISLVEEYPTPGRGRNEGWKYGNAPLVMFLDSDTEMDKDWLLRSVNELPNDVGAILGNREEMQPHASVFNWLGNLEWNSQPGITECFGGDVLVRRQALEETGGYDEELVGGEDPELSQRIRVAGWSIFHLDCKMTRHDLAMTRYSQYWRRAYRSGYGFAAVVDRQRGNQSSFWQREIFRITIRGGGAMALLLLSIFFLLLSMMAKVLLVAALITFVIAFLLLFFPRLFRVKNFMKDKGLSIEHARLYAWHCSVVVIPQFSGMLRYKIGKILQSPLRNKSKILATAAH